MRKKFHEILSLCCGTFSAHAFSGMQKYLHDDPYFKNYNIQKADAILKEGINYLAKNTDFKTFDRRSGKNQQSCEKGKFLDLRKVFQNSNSKKCGFNKTLFSQRCFQYSGRSYGFLQRRGEEKVLAYK